MAIKRNDCTGGKHCMSPGEECIFANVGGVGPEVTWVACGDFFFSFFFFF